MQGGAANKGGGKGKGAEEREEECSMCQSEFTVRGDGGECYYLPPCKFFIPWDITVCANGFTHYNSFIHCTHFTQEWHSVSLINNLHQ